MKAPHFSALYLSDLAKRTALAAALSLLAACTSIDAWTRQAGSRLPIEVVAPGSTRITTFRAHETSERLYVAGIVQPHPLTPSSHVDVQLIDRDGEIIAETHHLGSPGHPRTARGHAGQRSYVASFPLAEARQATRIRVTTHDGAHPHS